ncbi:MAG: hypothetical protein NTY66_02040 [Candidatus Vogelbacteria bacterium]|nr:hypothetical protein [Candidatus Vogelbacteria bacterium]
MNDKWRAYCHTMSAELGSESAEAFVGSLYRQTKGCVETAAKFFYQLGGQWSPLMSGWANWVRQNAEGPIAIILRDAKPLAALKRTASWEKLYLNRVICGIPDELSGDSSNQQDPLLKRYLSQNGCSKYFTFVDSGCYGSVVLELHKLGVKFKPLFFFSKNPNIRGFLNELEVPLTHGVILNDSLECGFPHIYQRPTEFRKKDEKVAVRLVCADRLSVVFGTAAMRGVRETKTDPKITPVIAVQKLLSFA